MNELLQELAERGHVRVTHVSMGTGWRCEVHLHDYSVAVLRSVTSDAFDTPAEAVEHCHQKLAIWDENAKEWRRDNGTH